jgi:hypothetical protein
MVPGPKEVRDDATHTRLIPTLVCAVFGAVIYTAPAQAEPSQRCTDHFVDSDSIDCSSLDPTWTFHDDFTDTYDVDGTVYVDADGAPDRVVEHWEQHSDEVNRVTGFSSTSTTTTWWSTTWLSSPRPSAARTTSCSGRASARSSDGTGHKVWSWDSDVPIQFSGPSIASDEDFCRAIA